MHTQSCVSNGRGLTGFISLCGERPAVFYVELEIGKDGIARLQAGFMDDGFIQGETLAPMDYTVCGADDRG